MHRACILKIEVCYLDKAAFLGFSLRPTITLEPTSQETRGTL